ncbi:MAG: polysaccharide pyruvyl transferase family protein [Leucobacter sp.]|nr:polysaccharide pyruvyl transferase family protein [Leucobacter sp.]
MRLLLVSLVDDNLGDNLIGICFRQLMNVVLENHGVPQAGSERTEAAAGEDAAEVLRMSLREIDEDLVATSDAIFFAGGGIVGHSYLGFNEYVDRITGIAQERGIPVVFSSLGINNMDADRSNADGLRRILDRSCVKAIAVRENLAEFRKHASRDDFELVSDPAVWSKWVYGLEPRRGDYRVGINVVRAGLFRANGRDWSEQQAFAYLAGLRRMLDGAGIPSVYYTNGSTDDNITLRILAERLGLPDDQVITPHTTREVVETVAGFDAIAAIRMHSSIIAYSFGIPTVTLTWNDKIPFFYSAIGHPERALDFPEWSSRAAFEQLRSFPREGERTGAGGDYEAFLMSLYRYLYRVVAEIVRGEEADFGGMYDFETVARALAARAAEIDEDATDLRFKLEKLETRYRDTSNEFRSVPQQAANLVKRILLASARLFVRARPSGR